MIFRTVGPYKVLDSKPVYRNRWLDVREDNVLGPDGTPGLFGVVDMKPGSSVLALTDSNEAVLVREFKFGIERESLEVISGGIEPDEPPLEAARRELREEAGFEAAEWVDLGVIDPFTTAIRCPNYLFLALGLKEVGQSLDAGEVLDIVKVPFARALEMAVRSEITHAASCVLLMKTERYLTSRL